MIPLKTCQANTIIENDKPIDFDKIRKLTQAEAKIVDQIIIDELSSDVLLINQIGKYIVNSGGKRLPPHAPVACLKGVELPLMTTTCFLRR